MSTRGAHNKTSCLTDSQVSVVCFKVCNSEVTISIKGKDVGVAATVDHVIPEEHGNVNLDKFHDRFINLSKGRCMNCTKKIVCCAMENYALG
jgi:hypothetical protein